MRHNKGKVGCKKGISDSYFGCNDGEMSGYKMIILLNGKVIAPVTFNAIIKE